MNAYFIKSALLFNEATKAYVRTADAPAEGAGCQYDALGSIVFAAAALEAWIGEMARLASRSGVLTGTPQLDAFSQVVKEAEESHGSVRLKYLAAKAILTGKPCDKGGRPYQDFKLLFKVRNALVHMKPEAMPPTEAEGSSIPPLVKELGLRAEVDMGTCTRLSWMDRIATRSVARWACNAAPDMVHSIRLGLQNQAQSELSEVILSTLAGSFARVK